MVRQAQANSLKSQDVPKALQKVGVHQLESRRDNEAGIKLP